MGIIISTCVNIPELDTNQVFYLGFDETGNILKWFANPQHAFLFSQPVEIEKEVRETFTNLQSTLFIKSVESKNWYLKKDNIY